MKKSLLFLSFLGLAASAQAQGPWTQANSPAPNIFSAYDVQRIHSLSPTLMWGVMSDRPVAGMPVPPAAYYVVTNNSTGAGDQFDFGTVSVTANAVVSNISGINATTAVAGAYPPNAGFTGPATYGGEILKTTNGGATWVKKTTATQFANGFCNWVHMFNATTGVALGDPTAASPTAFEILRTTDGGETWTRVNGVPQALAGEAANAEAFFALDGTGALWAGLASNNPTPVRVIKTTDFGQTWSFSTPVSNMTGSIRRLAFKDANNGICYGFSDNGTTLTSINVARTSDGGATWSPITPVNNATGNFYRNDIDAVEGRYYSVGPRFVTSPPTQVADDFGTSTSTDGINWTNMTNAAGSAMAATPGYFFTLDLIPGALVGANRTTVGYGGLFTSAAGEGGLFKFSRSAPRLLANRDAVLQSALSVYPNPSTTGVFNVALGTSLKSNAQLIVTDALGRQVKAQALTASAVGSQKLSLDLTGNKAGVYTLQIRTEAGIATQKIVIE